MKKKVYPIPPRFVIMNENGEFYAGMMYGQLYWSIDKKDAKPLDDLAKFEGMKRWFPGMEIIYDYID